MSQINNINQLNKEEILQNIDKRDISNKQEMNNKVLEAIEALQKAEKFDHKEKFTEMFIKYTSLNFKEECNKIGVLLTKDTNLLGKISKPGLVGVILCTTDPINGEIAYNEKKYESKNYWLEFFKSRDETKVCEFIEQDIYVFVLVYYNEFSNKGYSMMERSSIIKNTVNTIFCKGYKRTSSLTPIHSAYDEEIYEIWVPAPYNICINMGSTSFASLDDFNVFESDIPITDKNTKDITNVNVSVEWIEHCIQLLKLRKEYEHKRIKMAVDEYTFKLFKD